MRPKDWLEYALLRLGLGLFGSLSLATGLRIGAYIGDLLYRFGGRNRRIALFNLSIAFPEKSEAERDRIFRVSCRNLGRLVAEYCWMRRSTAAEVLSHIHWRDRAAWDAMVDPSRRSGVVVVTGHFGSWELLIYAHCLLGQGVALVHRPMRNSLVEAIIDGTRTGVGTHTLPKKSAARSALRALKYDHQLLGIPSDQNQTLSAGVFVNLFGKLASTTPGAARLAMMTGAPVHAMFLVRDGETDQHFIEVSPRIEMVSTGDRAADIVTNTQRCSDAVEDILRRYPEQWIWFHKRWKTRPPGEPKLYS